MPEYSFDTPEPIDLYVENGSGTVDVTAADVRTTEVRLDGRRADEVVVTHEGGTVSVVAPKHRGVFGDNKVDMELRIPADSNLTTKTGSADLRVGGRVNTIRIKSGSGDVEVAEVAGAGSIDTGSGDIAITDAAGQLRVRSGSGDLEVADLRAEATISTGSGDVEIRRSVAAVAVKTGSGDLTVGTSDTDITMSTGSGHLVVRTARRGRVQCKGASGDVRIGIPEATPVWTDVNTVTGRVSSGLDGVGEPEPGADYVEVRVTTASGDVELVPA